MDHSAAAILQVFAQYGFRKTAMDDVAKAAGKSRQALYNRFGSKEAVFSWAVETVTAGSVAAATAALSNTALTVEDRLLNAFDAWAGQHVDLLRAAPHGVEVIAAAKADMAERAAKAEAALAAQIAALLMAEGRVPDQARAEDATIALASASKGLLYTAQSRADYQATFARAIRAVVG